jgi:hypothetical protein
MTPQDVGGPSAESSRDTFKRTIFSAKIKQLAVALIANSWHLVCLVASFITTKKEGRRDQL